MERVAVKDKAPHFWASHVHMHTSIPKVGAAIQSPQLRHILGASAETLLRYFLHSDSALFHSYHISLPLLLATWVYKRQEGGFCFFFFRILSLEMISPTVLHII